MPGPSLSLSIDPELFAASALMYDRELVDGLFLKSGFWAAHKEVHGEGKPYWDNAPRRVDAITIGTHSTLTATPTGTEEIDTTQSQSLTEFVWRPGYTQSPVLISGLERRTTSGAGQMIDLWKQRAEAVHGNFWRKTAQHFVAGGVSGLADANWNSLNGIDRTYGFLEAAAVGSQSRTVGGLSKATYSAVPGLNNQYYAGGGSFINNGLVALDYMLTVLEKRAEDPSAIYLLASEAGKRWLKRAIRPLERFNDGKPANAGTPIEYFGKFKVLNEEYMPVSTTYGGSASASAPMTFAFVDFKRIFCCFGKPVNDADNPLPSGFFGMTKPTFLAGNVDVIAAKKQLFGQLVCKGLASSGVAANLETWS